MASINTITISGNLGKDPELKEFNSGTKKITFSVAVSEPIKSDGKWENKTVWVLVEFWGKDAEFINSYAQKGSFIVVNGRLSEDTWEKDGATQRKVYIKGGSFQLPKTSNEKVAEVNSNNVVNFSDTKSSGDFDYNIPF